MGGVTLEDAIQEGSSVVVDVMTTDYLNDILYTLAQIEGLLWFFVFVTVLLFLYRFIRVFV